MKPKLLIVDDDEDIRTQMKWALGKEYEVVLADDRLSALEAFREDPPAAVLLDLGLPPHPGDTEEGFRALEEILGLDGLTKVIVITGQTDKENALKAIGLGAYDFLYKPIETDELKVILSRAFYVSRLEREYRVIQQRFSGETFEGMYGSSPQMQQLFTTIRKVSTNDASVLILGESGTGKEMAALAIHSRSLRKDGPFITINCSAIPETLLESELFGHEKGAFTGAHVQRLGRVEMAAGGTLFLDEIGELSPPLQVKLLRYLQERRIERVGGRKSIEVDARVIAATNSDLQEALREGQFREDLYYRLAVVVISLPPLREREGDILLLAKTFLHRYAAENNRKLAGFSAKAAAALESHPWPGNVRELENRLKRAVIMAEGKNVTEADLEIGTAAAAPRRTSLKSARKEVDREIIQQALARNKGNISRSAAELGVSRPTLYELMDRLGLRKT